MKTTLIRRVLPLLAAVVSFQLAAGPAQAQPADSQRCRAAKLKLLGKYEGCVWKANSSAALTGAVADVSHCVSKVDEDWSKSDGKYGAACPGMTAASIRALLDGPRAPVHAALDDFRACGNGVKEEGEECDGADLGGQENFCQELGYPGGSVTCTATCTATIDCGPLCDPIAQDCPAGKGCYLDSYEGLVCRDAGDAAFPAACTSSTDCVAGSSCFDDLMGGERCYWFCNPTASTCAPSLTCVPIFGGTDIGICDY